MSAESASQQKKDYFFKELLAENSVTRTWLAEQVSIARPVIVEELRSERLDHKDAFLAEARAKAAIDHPLIASIYEAASGEEGIFYAMELLAGSNLEQFISEGGTLAPAQLASMLRRVSEAQIYHESLGQATLPLAAAHIHLDEHGVTRMANLVIPGVRDSSQSTADIARLGNFLQRVVAPDHSGTTRVLTLLSWMRGEDPEIVLDWKQVAELCQQIEQQLACPPPVAQTAHITPTKRRQILLPVLLVAFIIALLVVCIPAIRSRPAAPKTDTASSLPEPVLIPAVPHQNPDGVTAVLPSFRISAHEVTIGQYAQFLQMLEALEDERSKKIYDHDEQPAEKTTHVPDDWQALHQAAKSHGTWMNHAVTLDSPVVGVDWWDAYAYASWKKGRLPSQEEWHAAITCKLENPGSIPAADWQPVTPTTPDRTPNGLLGMAGGVSEWTSLPSVNPANPAAPPQWVIAGTSYLKTGGNALTREWLPDRSQRRPDLGFRLVFNVE